MSLLGSIISTAAGTLTGVIQQERQNAFNSEQARINRAFQASEAQLAYERSLQADSTKYQRQVADMEAAGINPMMAASSGAGTVQSSPASGSQASAANIGNLGALIIQGQQLAIQKKLAEAEVRNKNADTAKKESETTGQNLTNEINAATKDAKIELDNLMPELNRAKMAQIRKSIDDIDASIGKKIAETKESEERSALIGVQRLLFSAQERQLVELLPYQKILMSAQAENQRQAAILAAAHAAYQNRLLDDGYIDSFIRNMSAQADSSEARADVDKIKAALRTGDWSDVNPNLSRPVYKNFFAVVTNLLENLNPLNNMFK